jgi:hypothetical protein
MHIGQFIIFACWRKEIKEEEGIGAYKESDKDSNES